MPTSSQTVLPLIAAVRDLSLVGRRVRIVRTAWGAPDPLATAGTIDNVHAGILGEDGPVYYLVATRFSRRTVTAQQIEIVR